MKPELVKGDFVFCTLTASSLSDNLCVGGGIVGLVQEKEGVTVIVTREEAAQRGWEIGSSSYAMITLSVHSSLEAVGFLAQITRSLADSRINVNALSGYFHDHLFVPLDRAGDALELLHRLTKPHQDSA